MLNIGMIIIIIVVIILANLVILKIDKPRPTKKWLNHPLDKNL